MVKEPQVTTRGLIHSFLNTMDVANAWLTELETGLATFDRDRTVGAVLSLHHTWAYAEAVLALLEARTRKRVARAQFARDALQASRFFAREALARAWELFLFQHAAPPHVESPPEATTKPEFD
jgi:hypothetical protein